MEWQFRINWPALVEEAKQRRKAQRLTQVRLSKLAKVSTPTISRFESGEKDIQLSSVMRILGVLGLTDERTLVFPETKAAYDFTRGIVTFTGKDGDKGIACAISQEALVDHFDGDNKDPLKVFTVHRARIEQEVRRKYLVQKTEADGSILIRATDM
jgi:transcriptional regulator with XRE-family HTH domain